NEAQIEAFLGSHADFKLVPVADVWKQALGTDINSVVTPAPQIQSGGPGSIGKANASPPMDPGSQAGMTNESVTAGGAFLSLTPARNGTDGFFAAILERQKAEA